MSGITVVITGASSGIGRATAQMFARAGARIGLIARNEPRLRRVKNEVEARGGRALVLPLDVVDEAALDHAAEIVEREFGPIDIWINAAAAPMYAPFLRMTTEEFRRVTEVAYMGVVNGTRAALKRMTARNHGYIVQVASTASHRGVPLLSAYSGAKFAVRGFSEALRTELMHDGSRIHVAVVSPGSINTPLFSWARARLARGAPKPFPPVYEPELVATAIRFAIESRRREVFVGGAASALVWANRIIPGVLDRLLSWAGYRAQQSGKRPVERSGNLFETSAEDRSVHGKYGAISHAVSSQLWIARHGALLATAMATGAGLYIFARSLGRHPVRRTRGNLRRGPVF